MDIANSNKRHLRKWLTPFVAFAFALEVRTVLLSLRNELIIVVLSASTHHIEPGSTDIVDSSSYQVPSSLCIE
jgi:hypothetical protein